jgi:hypothetical protein
MDSEIPSNFDEILNNIKGEKIEFDPFSFMRNTEEVNQRSPNRIGRPFGVERPMTEIPFNISLTSFQFEHMKVEPIEYNNDSTFEGIPSENKENSAPKANKKRRRRNEKSSTSKRVKYDETPQKCTICNYTNSLKCVITRHINLHSHPGVIKCEKDKCYVLCSSKRNMRLHVKRSHLN